MASRAQMRWRAEPERHPVRHLCLQSQPLRPSGVRDGNRFRLSPDHTFSVGAHVRRGCRAAAGSASCRASPISRASSSTTTTTSPALQQPPNALVADNIQDETQGGYALANARLSYTFNDRFTIEAFVNNLFDEDYIKDAGNTGDAAGLPTFIAGEPRIYGVQADRF